MESDTKQNTHTWRCSVCSFEYPGDLFGAGPDQGAAGKLHNMQVCARCLAEFLRKNNIGELHLV